MKTIQSTILNIKNKLDKNNQEYLVLELNNQQNILVFDIRLSSDKCNNLQIGKEYQFIVKEGRNNSNVLIDYEKIWTDIHPDFTKELQQEWEQKGFDYNQVKEWIEAGAKVNDHNFIYWLRNSAFNWIEEKAKQWLLTSGNEKDLRREYKNWKKDSKLSSKIIEQIKNFSCGEHGKPELTPEQESLIEKLISNSMLRERYKEYGLCKECRQPNTGWNWCQVCNSQHFKENFQSWTSGNSEIDKCIRSYQLKATYSYKILEWIPYEQFTDIEYLAEGGFGKVYKAEWKGPIDYWDVKNNKWQRRNSYFDKRLALKSLHNSQNVTDSFLQEITNLKSADGSPGIIQCYGLSQDPVTKNYFIAMPYMQGGNLRQRMQVERSRFNLRGESNFYNKLTQLIYITYGLKEIHDQGLIHRDFHAGNILRDDSSAPGERFYSCSIADLGLCRPINEKDKDKVYGVLPYVAPEILRSKKYTQASDVYSFGIAAYELLSESPPYFDKEHDVLLALAICRGLRPNLNDFRAPQLLKGLISLCWDADPEQRPKIAELKKILEGWHNEIKNKKTTEFFKQYQPIEIAEDETFCQIFSRLYQEYRGQVIEAKLLAERKKNWREGWTGTVWNELHSEFCRKHNYDKYKEEKESWKEFCKLLSPAVNGHLSYQTYPSHPSEFYTSRLLDFKNLPEPRNSKEINEQFYKISKSMDFNMSEFIDGLEENQNINTDQFSEQQTAQIQQNNLPNFRSD